MVGGRRQVGHEVIARAAQVGRRGPRAGELAQRAAHELVELDPVADRAGHRGPAHLEQRIRGRVDRVRGRLADRLLIHHSLIVEVHELDRIRIEDRGIGERGLGGHVVVVGAAPEVGQGPVARGRRTVDERVGLPPGVEPAARRRELEVGGDAIAPARLPAQDLVAAHRRLIEDLADEDAGVVLVEEAEPRHDVVAAQRRRGREDEQRVVGVRLAGALVEHQRHLHVRGQHQGGPRVRHAFGGHVALVHARDLLGAAAEPERQRHDRAGGAGDAGQGGEASHQSAFRYSALMPLRRSRPIQMSSARALATYTEE